MLLVSYFIKDTSYEYHRYFVFFCYYILVSLTIKIKCMAMLHVVLLTEYISLRSKYLLEYVVMLMTLILVINA